MKKYILKIRELLSKIDDCLLKINTDIEEFPVWFTRDSKNGDDPDQIFMHTSKPELVKGQWTNNGTGLCYGVPEVKPGKSKKVILDVEA